MINAEEPSRCHIITYGLSLAIAIASLISYAVYTFLAAYTMENSATPPIATCTGTYLTSKYALFPDFQEISFWSSVVAIILFLITMGLYLSWAIRRSTDQANVNPRAKCLWGYCLGSIGTMGTLIPFGYQLSTIFELTSCTITNLSAEVMLVMLAIVAVAFLFALLSWILLMWILSKCPDAEEESDIQRKVDQKYLQLADRTIPTEPNQEYKRNINPFPENYAKPTDQVVNSVLQLPHRKSPYQDSLLQAQSSQSKYSQPLERERQNPLLERQNPLLERQNPLLERQNPLLERATHKQPNNLIFSKFNERNLSSPMKKVSQEDESLKREQQNYLRQFEGGSVLQRNPYPKTPQRRPIDRVEDTYFKKNSNQVKSNGMLINFIRGKYPA